LIAYGRYVPVTVSAVSEVVWFRITFSRSDFKTKQKTAENKKECQKIFLNVMFEPVSGNMLDPDRPEKTLKVDTVRYKTVPGYFAWAG
jgi:hypothetical protein